MATCEPPDLSAGQAWLAGRAAVERKRTGQWATPWWVVDAVAARIAPTLPPRPTVLDPACGDGRWLLAVARHRPDARLVGYDLDTTALDAARRTLGAAGVSAELTARDALTDPMDWPSPLDAVVGNPPWIRPQNLRRDVAVDLWQRFGAATNKADIYACFVERSLAAAPQVAVVLPENWLSLSSFAALRALVREAGVREILQLPPRLFDATVRSVFLWTGRDDRRAGDLDTTGATHRGHVHLGPDAWTLGDAPPELAGVPLGSVVRFYMGVVCGDYPRYVHEGKIYAEDRPTCRGRDIQRWCIATTDEHLRWLPRDMLRRKPYVAPKHAGLYDLPHKVVVAGTSGTELRAAMDTERRFPLDSCYVALPRSDVDPYGILGLLLSRQVGGWYAARHRAARVKGVELARIPVPPPPWPHIAAAARARDEAALDVAVDEAYERRR